MSLSTYSPKISVVMPVFNAQAYLKLAIKSILDQNFEDFEFLIINDGSTDRSEKIVQSFHDHRIKFFSNATNLGIVPTLNRGLELAKGEFIARMDSDDISHPSRLKMQLSLLELHAADICGCHYEIINSSGAIKRKKIFVPLLLDEITACLANTVPFAHGSVMMRNSFIKKNNLLYGPCHYAEDYDLWIRFLQCGARFHNADFFLYQYRVYNESLSMVKSKQYAETAFKLRRSFVLGNRSKCKEAFVSLIGRHSFLRNSDKVNLIFLSYLLWRQGDSFSCFMQSFRRVTIKTLLHGLCRIWRV
jgi:glycosyltransferase involved in cell wall biosynthesis